MLSQDHFFRFRQSWHRFAGAASAAPLISGTTTCALAAVLCLGRKAMILAAVVKTSIVNYQKLRETFDRSPIIEIPHVLHCCVVVFVPSSL